jgi:hypothetical protein
VLCKQGVTGSIPVTSTVFFFLRIELGPFARTDANLVEPRCAKFCDYPFSPLWAAVAERGYKILSRDGYNVSTLPPQFRNNARFLAFSRKVEV